MKLGKTQNTDNYAGFKYKWIECQPQRHPEDRHVAI